MRILDTDMGAIALEALDNLAQDAMIHVPSDNPGQTFQRALAVQLEIWFPWLGTDDDAGSGADIIAQIGAIHEDLLLAVESNDEES